ncbi:hypothetical protein HPG69_000791, partial [Diceros bicornis minor]
MLSVIYNLVCRKDWHKTILGKEGGEIARTLNIWFLKDVQKPCIAGCSGNRPDIMSSGDDQQSRAFAKPTFSEVQASALVESVFGLKVSKIQPLPSYDDQNFHVCIPRTEDATDGPTEYVLKINNTEASKTPDLIEVQSHIIMFLRAAGFPTASVYRTKGDDITSLVSVGSGSEIKSYLVRLLTYLPGRPIAEIPISPQLLYEIGRLAAKLDKTLE